MNARSRYYAEAHIHIDTDGLTVDQVTDKLVEEIQNEHS